MSDKVAKPANRWVKFDLKLIPSETPLRIRKGEQKATVVLSQHNQFLEGDDRRLVEWEPAEFNLAVSEDAAPAEA